MRSLCFGLLLLPQVSWAEGPKPTRFVLPQRLTVGPFDNYQGSVSHDETFLYFTRSENLASQLMKLDLRRGVTETLTDKTADAKSPFPSPDGEQLAYSSFRRDAKGDVCVAYGDKQQCIGDPGRSEQSPFWVDAQRLGYVVSNDAGTDHEIWVYDTRSRTSEKWMDGLFHSPSLDATGTFLVAKGRKNELEVYRWQNKSLFQKITMPLAGSTGPARFSQDGKWLYFAQYMVDSNRDLQLDGRDAAAIFRLDWQAKDAFPEQLTSLEQNCSFPQPAQERVYVTCAFEGSLDIYALPLRGMIPESWEVKDLWQAHESARSYADRVLLLNHIYGRFQGLSVQDFQQRTLANFIFMGEYRPALFYAQKIAQETKDPEAELESILLDTYGRWEVLPEKNKLGGFARFLDDQEKKIRPFKSYPIAQIAQAYFDFFGLEEEAAETKLRQIPATATRVLFWKGRLEALLYKAQSPELYQARLEANLFVPGMSLETRLYYLSEWLEWVEGQSDGDQALAKLLLRLTGPEAAVVQNEIDLVALIKSKENSESIALFRKIAARSAEYKSQAYPLRLMFNRSLIRLSRAKRTNDMADVVSLYISHLAVDGKEFPYALDALRQNSLDTAYRYLRGPETERIFALGSFFTAARMADDWESHYQYALRQDQGIAELLKQYEQMQADKMIRPESVRFVKVLIQLMDPKQKDDPKTWKNAVAELEALPEQALGVGAKYLVMGYLYQRLLTHEGNGFSYNKELAEKAHRAYLFAIDASFGNDRILAAALQNLGLLHLRLRNFSLASAYLAKRAEYPSESAEASYALAWVYADSLAKSNRYREAYQALQTVWKDPTASKEASPAMLEKMAFYAWNAGLYAEAVEAYEAYFAKPQVPRTAPLHLGYGYALSRAGRWEEARGQWLEVIRQSRENKFQDVDGPALVPQEGLSAFLAWGLLAQGRYPLTQRLEALEKRLALYPNILERAKLLHQSPETLASQRIKEILDTVPLHISLGQDELAEQKLRSAVQSALEFGKEYQFLSHTCLQTLKNAFVLRERKSLRRESMDKVLNQLSQSVEKAFEEEKEPTPLVTEKWLELALLALWDEQRGKAGGQQTFERESAALLEQKKWEASFASQKSMKPALQIYVKNLAQAML